MPASIEKLIHKVNSSTANLTCILTNGIAYQFFDINSHVHCTMLENTATQLDEPLVLVPFILKLCMAIFFCFSIQFCKLQARDLNCLLEIQVPRH